LAVVPEIGHRVGEGLERVVRTPLMRSKRSSSRRNLSSQANTRSIVRKRSLKMAGWKIGLRPRLGCFLPREFGVDVGNHAAVEDHLAVGSAIVDAIKTDDAAAEIHAHLPNDAHYFGQCLPQERRFVAIARRHHKRRDHVAPAIAEGDDLCRPSPSCVR
jgi:hypothetical protein